MSLQEKSRRKCENNAKHLIEALSIYPSISTYLSIYIPIYLLAYLALNAEK